DRLCIYAEQVGERLQVGGQGHDRTDVEIAVGPAVQSLTYSGSKRVIHGGVAERTLNAHRSKISVLFKQPCHSDDRVELQQRQCRRGIVEVDLPLSVLLLWPRRHPIPIPLQSARKRSLGPPPAANSAVLLARDRFVQLQSIAPESLAAKGVGAKDAPAIVDHLSRMRVDRRIKTGTLMCLSLCSDLLLTPKQSGSEQQYESQSFFHRKASPSFGGGAAISLVRESLLPR